MSEAIEILIRGIVVFIFLMIIVHLIGKQIVGQLTYTHFVTAITLGSIAGNTVFNIEIKFVYFIISLFIFGLIAWILTLVAFKYHKSRTWIEGKSTVIVENGHILEERMKRINYSMDSLSRALRKKDIFDFHEVECAVLEPDGSVSVLKKEEFRNVKRKDLFPEASPSTQTPVELIIEGKIMEHINQQGLTKEWLEKEILSRGLGLSNIFYAVRGSNGKLYFDLYDDNDSSSGHLNH